MKKFLGYILSYGMMLIVGVTSVIKNINNIDSFGFTRGLVFVCTAIIVMEIRFSNKLNK
ncbi:MAG: hypothetical protein GY928_33530 [Colwellia sp.]|nr:hypothetical protein [Colwellia sp.]